MKIKILMVYPNPSSNLISGISAPAIELKDSMSVVAPTGSSALILGPNWFWQRVSIKRHSCCF